MQMAASLPSRCLMQPSIWLQVLSYHPQQSRPLHRTMVRKSLSFTEHAEAMLVERNIQREWVEDTLADPEEAVPDPRQPEVWHAFRAIAERRRAHVARGLCGIGRGDTNHHGVFRQS